MGVRVVTELSVSVRKKVASLIRLMGSNQEGERLGSVHGLDRTLTAAGFDFHTLADHIEQANGSKLSEAEMKKLYDAGHAAGYEAGVRAAEAKVPHDTDGFRDINDIESWREIVRFCQQRNAHLRSKDRDFIDDMLRGTKRKQPTPKQAVWLQDIYLQLGGRP
jgi:hypothetical protein